ASSPALKCRAIFKRPRRGLYCGCTMPETLTFEELKAEADKVFEAFAQDFRSFNRFVIDQLDGEAVPRLLGQLQKEKYSLSAAESDAKALSDLKSKYTGKKS